MTSRQDPMDSDLSLEFLRVVEQAAIACAHTMGQGDGHKSDQAAVEAMRQCARHRADRRHDRHRRRRARRGADAVHRREGRARRATRRRPSASCPKVDIAVDPLEGTNLCATGAPNAMAVLAASDEGGLLHAPDLYMEKLVVGAEREARRQPRRAGRATTSRRSPVARRDVEDLVVIVLDRPRHETLIAEIRATGARIRLIRDGDLVGRHCRRGRRQRRARGDGHRRRAGRRADRGGDALPERRDLRAAGGQEAASTRSAAARWASPISRKVYTLDGPGVGRRR